MPKTKEEWVSGVAILFLVAICFIVDLRSPNDFVMAFGYVLPVALAARRFEFSGVIATVVLCSFLTILPFFPGVDTQQSLTWPGLGNRLLVVFAFCVVASLTPRLKKQIADTNSSRLPTLLLVIGALSSMCVVLGMAALSSFDQRRSAQQDESIMNLSMIAVQLARLDETLTMSARMAAQTGDLFWKERYDESEVALENAFNNALRLLPEDAPHKGHQITQSANTELVKLEQRVFSLVAKGDLTAAQQLIGSKQYRTAKAQYADGLSKLQEDLLSMIAPHLDERKESAEWQRVMAYNAIALILIIWAGMYLMLHRWKKTESENQKLIEQESQQAQLLVDAAPYPVIVNSVEDQILLYVNSRAQDLFGFVGDGVSDTDPSDFVIESKDVDNIRATLQTDSQLTDYEARLKKGDGSEFWASLSGIRFRFHDKLATYLSIRDITEQKEKELELERAYRELKKQKEDLQALTARLRAEKKTAEAALAAKSDFLAMMSHEIRTPMNGVIGIIEVLRRSDLNLQQKEYLDIVMESSETLLTIINDILDYSKLESGKVALENEPVDIWEQLASITALLSPNAEKKGLSLSLETEGSTAPCILTDQSRFRQVLTNLIGNAIKFTEDGNIQIHSRIQDATDEMTTIEVSITDTGIGIPDGEDSAIFEMFTQGSNRTGGSTSGTGLGLSICRMLVQSMGGEISAKANDGVGSTFTFTIKGHPAPYQTEQLPYQDESISDFGHVRVLVAEDTPINQRVIRVILDAFNIEPVIVNDGVECLKELRTNTYDIVFMDIRMPNLDGLSAVKLMRLDKTKYQDTPVVALTANALADDKAKYLSAGMDDFIAKPIAPSEVLRVLTKFVPQSGTPARNRSTG